MQPTHTAKLYQAIAQTHAAPKLNQTGTETSKYTTATSSYKPNTPNYQTKGYSGITQSPKNQATNSSSRPDNPSTQSYPTYSDTNNGKTQTSPTYQNIQANNQTYQPSTFKVQSNQDVKPSTASGTVSSYQTAPDSKYVPLPSSNLTTVQKKKIFSDTPTAGTSSNYQLNTGTNATATYLPLKKYESTPANNSTTQTPSNKIDTPKYYTPTSGNTIQGSNRSVTPPYYRPYTNNTASESSFTYKGYNPPTRNDQYNTNQDSKVNSSFQGYSTPKGYNPAPINYQHNQDSKVNSSFQGYSTPKGYNPAPRNYQNNQDSKVNVSFQGYSTPKETIAKTTTTTTNYSSTQKSTVAAPLANYDSKKNESTTKPYEPSYNTTSHKRIPINYTSNNYTPSNNTPSNPSTPGGNYKYYQPKNLNMEPNQASQTNTYTNLHAPDKLSLNKVSSEKYIPSSATNNQYSNSHFAPNRYDSPSRQHNDQKSIFNTAKPSEEKIESERPSYSKEINTYAYEFGIQSHKDKFLDTPSETKDRVNTDGLIIDMTESRVKDRPRLRASMIRDDDVINNGSESPVIRFVDSGKLEYNPPVPSFNKVQSRLYPLTNKNDTKDDSSVSPIKVPLFSPLKTIIQDGRSSISQATFRHFEIPETLSRSSRKSAKPVNRLSEIGRDILSKCSEKSSGVGSKYFSLLEKLLKEGKKYVDPEFKPDIASLAGDDQFRRQKWAKYVWCRPEEIYGDGYEIFYEGIDINDIHQGILGNCYFLSVLSALAEFPHLVMKLFVSPDVNKAGCYAVRICDGGEWKEIIVDDLIPCKPGNPQSGEKPSPIFSRGNGKELWVMLLEKAWAKNFGSYAKIDSGFTRETMRDLTGAPTEYFIPNEDDNEMIWEKIMEGDEKSYVMTCGAGDIMSGQDLLASCGLVGSHAYSLISAAELHDRQNSRNVKLVKLRNPWGKSEWNRAWSDGDSRWTQSLKKQVGLEERDDGIFFMEFFDFVQYFGDVQICRVNDFYHYYFYKTKSLKNEYKFYRIKCVDPGHYYITVNQPNKRHFKKSDQYLYSESWLTLAKIHKEKGVSYEYLDGLSYGNKEVWVEGDMSIGEYVLCVNIDWASSYNEFVLSSYGPGECIFEEMGVSSPKPKEFLEKVYMNHAAENSVHKMRSVAGTGIKRAMMDRLKDGKEGVGYLFYRNEDNIGFKVEANFVRKTGIELLFEPKDTSKINFEIKPGETKIILWQIGFDEANISIQESLVKCK